MGQLVRTCSGRSVSKYNPSCDAPLGVPSFVTLLQHKGIAMKNFLNMMRDDSGAAAAEYALILAVIGAGIIVSAVALGDAIDTVVDCTGDTITTRTDSC